MNITVRNHTLLRLFGFDPVDESATVTFHHSYWVWFLWNRITGRVRGWKHPRMHGPRG